MIYVSAVGGAPKVSITMYAVVNPTPVAISALICGQAARFCVQQKVCPKS